MHSIIALVRRRGIDALTAGCFGLAVFLIFQPGSLLRVRWHAYRLNAEMRQASTQNWAQFVQASSPLFGGGGSPQIVEIGDYECPFCRQSNAAVDSAVNAGVRISYLNYPLPIHPQARGAALVALCAGESGRFREMHEHLMTSSTWQKDSNWTREMRAVGVSDMALYDACLRSVEMTARLDTQVRLGKALLVQGTPTFVARGAVHQGTISFREIVELSRQN